MLLVDVPEGVILEPIGDAWVGFSPLSGQTSILNSEAAAFLEVLLDGPRELQAAIGAYAAEVGVSSTLVEVFLLDTERELRTVGLIRDLTAAAG